METNKKYFKSFSRNNAEFSAPYDFYSTNKDSVRTFLKEFLKEHEINYVWECACGKGNIAKVLDEFKIKHIDTDLIDRNFGTGNVDFLEQDKLIDNDIDVIMTNPPFKFSDEFIEKAIELKPSKYIIIYFALTILEGKNRYNKIWSMYNPYRVYIHPSRQGCDIEGREEFKNSGPRCYLWLVFDTQDYSKDPVIKWLPINS